MSSATARKPGHVYKIVLRDPDGRERTLGAAPGTLPEPTSSSDEDDPAPPKRRTITLGDLDVDMGRGTVTER